MAPLSFGIRRHCFPGHRVQGVEPCCKARAGVGWPLLQLLFVGSLPLQGNPQCAASCSTSVLFCCSFLALSSSCIFCRSSSSTSDMNFGGPWPGTPTLPTQSTSTVWGRYGCSRAGGWAVLSSGSAGPRSREGPLHVGGQLMEEGLERDAGGQGVQAA